MRVKLEAWADVVRNAPLVGESGSVGAVCDLILRAPEIAGRASAGQFVSMYTDDPSKLLPRPISICGIDREEGTLRLIYRVTGPGTGTERFSRLESGERIRVIGPLGNGFQSSPAKALVVGGGIGIPPMLELTKQLRREQPDTEFRIVLGYRNADTFLRDEFEEQGRVVVASEDGSVGVRGNVLDAIRTLDFPAEVIYACGPLPMLRGLKAYALEQKLACYLSLEERMACGLGACLACVCRTTETDSHSNVKNRRICRDGPVFEAREVELD